MTRRFHAPRPDALWLSGLTYVATSTGFVYVAVVIDAFARRIVGWRVSRSRQAAFVLDALEQAVHDRRPADGMGLVHQSDSKCMRAGVPGRSDPHSDGPRSVAGAAWRPVAA